ncbi:MAG: SdpI family protein [Pseudomonadota bacterium]
MKPEEKLAHLTCYLLPVIFIGVSLPLVLNVVEPNSTYGFRTQAAFECEECWYQVNQIGGLFMLTASFISAAAIFYLHTRTQLNPVAKLLICLVLPLPLIVSSVFIATFVTS